MMKRRVAVVGDHLEREKGMTRIMRRSTMVKMMEEGEEEKEKMSKNLLCLEPGNAR